MSAEMLAGSAGHAFLASWLVTRDLPVALAAFDRVAAGESTRPPSRPGWLSASSASLFNECPAKFYLSRLHAGTGVDRVWPVASGDAQLKAIAANGKRLAEAREACEWLASDPRNDGSDTEDTWATELYLETTEPTRWRMFVDHLVWCRDVEALAVRDHKFTWRADGRTLLRVAYSDQLKLYAATWNTAVRESWRWGAADTAPLVDLPPIRYIIPNVIVVSSKGAHQVMPAEPIYFSEEAELAMLARLARDAVRINAFSTIALDQGWPFAAQHMHTNSCVGFSVCAYAPACHEGALDTSLFVPSARHAEPIQTEDA